MKRRVTTSLLERNPHQSTYIMHYISLYKNVIVVRSGTPPIRWNQNFTLITGLGRTPTMLKSKSTLLSEQAKPAIQSIHTYLGRVTARIYPQLCEPQVHLVHTNSDELTTNYVTLT